MPRLFSSLAFSKCFYTFLSPRLHVYVFTPAQTPSPLIRAPYRILYTPVFKPLAYPYHLLLRNPYYCSCNFLDKNHLLILINTLLRPPVLSLLPSYSCIYLCIVSSFFYFHLLFSKNDYFI